MLRSGKIPRKTLISGIAGALAVPCVARAESDTMASVTAAARAEGGVVVDGPPMEDVHAAIVRGFQTATGVPVTYITSGGAATGARVRAERAAGKYLLDVVISGSDTPTLTLLPSGWLDRIEPVLVAPDVVDRRKWRDGHLWYQDEAHTILRMLQFVTPELAINTKLVKPSELPTWTSLLDPKWRGKIVAKDPGIAGAGSALISYFYMTKGPDFVKKLYRDQQPVFSQDPRQQTQWLAQGNYPILVGPDSTVVYQLQKLGYPIAPLFPSDGPGVVTAGWGLLCLMNKAPHPNAAKLFVNWLAGRAGQEVFGRTLLSVSLRTDIDYGNALPPYVFLQKKSSYVDTSSLQFVTEQRGPAFEKARAVLGE
jgi:iron(III) transport system substrate-binding protein